MMFKKRNVANDLINEEGAYNEAILRLTSARTRVAEQELVWANSEDNPNFFTLFGKLSELQWICNDATECMANKQSGVKKAFKNIFQEEKILEESKKELQLCSSKLSKLQKQVESAKKKNDTSKLHFLEIELATQSTHLEELTSSVDAQTEKLEIYKIKELKRSLHCHAEGVLTLAGHVQQLYAAYMQLLDMMPDTPPTSKEEEGPLSSSTGECLERSMREVVSHVSDLLDIHPPVSGGIDPKRLACSSAPSQPSCSPHTNRRSFVDQLGLDLFRPKSKDDLCPSHPPPPAVRPKKPSQKPHSVYKVDTGAADEVESVAGRSSTSPLPSPISLSQVTGIIVEEEKGQRSQVDYTQGMYCEIVIPERDEGSPPLLFQGGQTTVPVRRTSSDSPPHEVKHSRNLSLDRKLDRGLFEQTLKHSRPLESTTDSGSASALYSSSEDFEGAVGEVEHAYARVNIRPLGGGGGGGGGPSREYGRGTEDSSGGYANPMDAVNLPTEVIQKRLSMGVGIILDERSSELSEEKHNSPYQSVEDVRKMRELQNNRQRHSYKSRSHSVSPNTSQINLRQMPEEEINYYDDNPGYSRPFDAIPSGSHLKVSTENLTKKPPFTPLPPPPPPAMRRTGSGDRPGKERSARSLHKTNLLESETERGSCEDLKNPVAPRGSGQKRSWKVGESGNHANGSVTPPPPLPLSDRPRAKEQWQLPRQRQSDVKPCFRSKSSQAFLEEFQAAKARSGVDAMEPPSRGEMGRTVSEGAGAMNRLRTKPPVMTRQQLKGKKTTGPSSRPN